jgi:ferric-dicitrate binding protein FerR (iron transport regulator)
MSRVPVDRPPYEALSRLAAGELPSDEALALRQRIETDPAVATAWADLLRLVEGLGRLPEERPPAALDAAVLGAAPRSRRRWDRPAAAIALAAAAVAAWTLWPTPPAATAAITLADGVQWVDGAALVVAGDVPVRIDGRARIEVEPRPAVAREPRPSEGPMDSKVAIGAAFGGGVAGALLTVAVYEGTATVSLPEGPVVVEAGEARRFDPPGAGAPAPSGGGSVQDQVAALRAENAALRDQLAEAQFTGAMARGQVAATQGEPVPWPDDVPAEFRPEAFEALLRAEVAKLPGFEVRAVDCSEYPCVTTVMAPAGEGWQGTVRQLAEGVSGALGDDVGTWMGLAVSETDAGTVGGVGMAFAPGDAMSDDAVRTRLDWRAGSMLHEITDELEGHEGHGDGGEVDALDVLEDVESMIPRPKRQNGP